MFERERKSIITFTVEKWRWWRTWFINNAGPSEKSNRRFPGIHWFSCLKTDIARVFHFLCPPFFSLVCRLAYRCDFWLRSIVSHRVSCSIRHMWLLSLEWIQKKKQNTTQSSYNNRTAEINRCIVTNQYQLDRQHWVHTYACLFVWTIRVEKTSIERRNTNEIKRTIGQMKPK